MGTKDKLGTIRRKSTTRVTVIVILMIILGIMFYYWRAARIWIAGLFLLLVAALGLEISGNDWDLQKLMQTGSFSESRVEKTQGGHWIIGEECQKDKLNCANFSFQEDAQDLFEKCGGLENDIHGLDRDSDGLVCEHLPRK